MTTPDPLVFLLDVDNTLLDNDGIGHCPEILMRDLR